MVSDRPNVIYIMGTGRSGSTVLEILLSQSLKAFGAGELFNLLEDGYDRNAECSCGQSFSDCDVWSQLKREVSITQRNRIALQRESKALEKHVGCLQAVVGLKTISKGYADFNDRVFRTLRDINGVKYIIDSSKYPGRALALHRLHAENVWVIWLTRSPNGILRSFQKPNKDEQKPKNPIMAAAYIGYVTLMAYLAKRKLGSRCLTIKYEDLIENPVREMNLIESWSGIDLSYPKKLVTEDRELSVGHLVTANRIRKNKRIKLSRDNKPVDYGFGSRFLATGLKLWYRLLGIG